MSRKFAKTALYLIMIVAVLALAGCGGTAATPAPSGGEAAPTVAAEKPAAIGQPQVGIVLPTKDEPRWLQDEARFKELLATANVPVEILFS